MTEQEKERIYKEYSANNMEKLKRVIYKYVSMFGDLNSVDYEEYVSMANYNLWKIVESFDDTKNDSFEAYLRQKMALKMKQCKTYLNRDVRQQYLRDKNGNKILDESGKPKPIPISNVYIDAPAEDGLDMKEKIADSFNLEEEIYNQTQSLSNKIDGLSKVQKNIVDMLSEGYSSTEIKERLNIPDAKYSDYIKELKTNDDLLALKNNKRKAMGSKMENLNDAVYELDVDFENLSEEELEKLLCDNNKTDSQTLGSLIEKVVEGDINLKHALQRLHGQWKSEKVNKYYSTILNNDPVPELIICEQTIKGKIVKYLIDGLQRLWYAKMFKYGGFMIGENGAEKVNVLYKDYIKDESGNKIFDEQGNPRYKIKVFNIIGKKYDELPEFLKRRFEDYNMTVTTFFNCTSREVAYHCRRYNGGEKMNISQESVTHVSEECAASIKNISQHHDFFKDCGKYTSKNSTKGVIDRVVFESIMTINFLEDWKKNAIEMFTYVDNNATKEHYDQFATYLDRLYKVHDDKVKGMFNTTNSMVWFGLFSRFAKTGIDDSKFVDFMYEFSNTLKDKEIDGIKYDDFYIDKNTGKKKSTKDKSVVIGRITHLEKLMNEYLHIEKTEENEEEIKEETGIDIDVKSENVEESTLDFIKRNVSENIEERDLQFYEELFDDFTIEVDNDSKLLQTENIKSLLAMVAYSVETEKDTDFGNWLPDFFNRNNTYIENQQENYIHMKKDFEEYIRKETEVSA